MSGCAFRFQYFHHFVGGGGGGVLFEIAGNHKDGVPPAYLGHAIRAAGGSGGASVGWGGNPNKIPAGQNERLAKFGTVVESCS